MTTIQCPPLAHIFRIITDWERAERIRIFHAWISDSGEWIVAWDEGSKLGSDLYQSGERHLKTSRLIADLKEALKTHNIPVNHIFKPFRQSPGGSLRAWTGDGLYYLRWEGGTGGGGRTSNKEPEIKKGGEA
jgi:hypothetical protein